MEPCLPPFSIADGQEREMPAASASLPAFMPRCPRRIRTGLSPLNNALGERRRDGLLVGVGEAAAHGVGGGSVFEGLAQGVMVVEGDDRAQSVGDRDRLQSGFHRQSSPRRNLSPTVICRASRSSR